MNPLIAIAAQVFPAIISALAGDKGGAIATQVAKAVTDVTGAKTADDAKQKVAADPKVAADLQVKLAQIALDAQRAASQQDIAEDALALDSTKNARTTLKALAEINNPIENTPAYVSYIVIAGFFVTVLLLFSPLPNWLGTKDPILQIINICIGAITAAFTTVVQFWLGSSLGSKEKGNTLAQSAAVSNLSDVMAATKPSQPPASQPPVLQPVVLQPAVSQPAASQPAVSQPAPATTAGPDRFPACIPLTLAWEGGNDDDPNDPGGRTSRGIIQREWDVWRQTHSGLPSDVWQAPQEQILAIYRQKYWDALSCGQLPAGIDYCVFDYGVNSGISRSAQVLQQLLGTTVDGDIGPLTIAAAAKADAASLANKICDQRLAFLKGLRTWEFFRNGWTRRVEGVRKQATAMIGATTIPVPATTPPMSVTIHAVPVNGGSQTTITIDKTGPDMGRLITNGQSFNVFNVQASPDGEKLVCNTQYLFWQVTITVAVFVSQAPGKAKVSVTIENGPPGQNGTTEYLVTAADETNLVQFVVDSHFPVLMQT